jgi:hypothetical protein
MKRTKIWPILLSLLLVTVILPFWSAAPARAAGYPLSTSDPRVTAALDFLRNSEAAYPTLWRGGEKTCYAIVAIDACGADPHDFKNAAGESMVDIIRDDVDKYLKPQVTASLPHEYYLLAIVAAGEDPHDFGGVDVADQLLDMFDGTQMGQPGIINDDFWAIIALVGAGVSPSSTEIQTAKQFIIDHQGADGGWGSNVSGGGMGGGSDPCDTANAIMALIAAGVSPSSSVIQDAFDFIHAWQNEDGGFPYYEGTAVSDVATDARVMAAVRACGGNPTSAEWTINGNNPFSHALSLQNDDGGFAWVAGGGTDGWMTTYIMPALVGKYWPTRKVSGGSSSAAGGDDYEPYFGDSTPPEIASLVPSQDETVTTLKPKIVVSYSDDGSGIDVGSVVLMVNGVDVSSACEVRANQLSYLPAEEMAVGTVLVRLAVKDNAGNNTYRTWKFTIAADDGSVAGGGSGMESFSLSAKTDASGVAIGDIILTSPDATRRLEIGQGTTVSDPGGLPLQSIIIELKDSVPALTSGYCRIGTAVEFGPDGTTFDQPVTLTFSYEELSSQESLRWDTNGDGTVDLLDKDIVVAPEDFCIAYYATTTNRWVFLGGTVDQLAKTVTAEVEHFTLFSLVAPVTGPLVVKDILVSPETVNLGEDITFTAIVENPGQHRGTYILPLKIDGYFEDSQEVTLEPGEHEVSFVHREPYTGRHEVTIGETAAEFSVNEVGGGSNWWDSVDVVFYIYIVVGVLCAVVIAGIIILARVWRRRGG